MPDFFNGLSNNATLPEFLIKFVNGIFNICWYIPFHMDFFGLGFSFGHVIYGMMVIGLACVIFRKMLSGEHGFHEVK